MEKRNNHESIINGLWKQVKNRSELCDVIIENGEKEIWCHWCMLVASPFFEKLYFSGLQERLKGRISVQHEFAPNFLDDVIGFIYGQDINIGKDSCHQLLSLSHFLMIHKLRDDCLSYIKKTLTFENCLDEYKFLSIFDLDVEIDGFILGNLPSVLKHPKAVEFTKEFILYIVTDDRLQFVPKTDLLHFFVRWVNKEPEARIHQLEDIMNCVDLSYVPLEIIVGIFETLSVPLKPQAMTSVESTNDIVHGKDIIVFTNLFDKKTCYFCPDDLTHGSVFLHSQIPYEFRNSVVSGGIPLHCLHRDEDRKYIPFSLGHADIAYRLHTLYVKNGIHHSKELRIRLAEANPAQRKPHLKLESAMLVDNSNATFLICKTSSKDIYICQRDSPSERKEFYVTIVQIKLRKTKEQLHLKLRSAILIQNRYICIAMSDQMTVFDNITNQLVNGSFTVSNFHFCQFNAGVAVFFEGARTQYLQMEIYFENDTLKVEFKKVQIPIITNIADEFLYSQPVVYTTIANKLFALRSSSKYGYSSCSLSLHCLVEDDETELRCWKKVDLPREMIRAIERRHYFLARAPIDISLCSKDCPHCTFLESQESESPVSLHQQRGVYEREQRAGFWWDRFSLIDRVLYFHIPPQPSLPKKTDMPQKRLHRRKMYYKRLRR